MTSLIIIACSATKRSDSALMPAIERYDGPAFRVLRRALRERAGLAQRLTVLILSAECGLIGSARPIPHYNRRMTRARAAELAPAVAAGVYGPWTAIYVAVGQAYRAALPPPPWPTTTDAGHGGIGERLHQLKEWLWTTA